ncbi:lipopolysaccharide biosynthesis protein [Sphingobacterium composti Ten et al. 2007 non Yoo et al. 2007]|uniref:lipopolysaccharide biosynthesis protein n=1 Tax=Sphingobacterium composti TaxID=363260 RepID=UPI00135A4140|nr:lipopolysaccharide biosynthesis protein [Sphingobacterium composti Ten et al. 2007 non Yoo et al. 2007]
MEEKAEEVDNSLKKKTAKGLFFGGFSNVLQQIIGFFFGIILNRYFISEEDLGKIAVIMIFPLIATAFQESGFVVGLINKKNIQHKDYNAVFWCSLMISTFLYFLLFLAAPYIANFYNNPELVSLYRFQFLSIWFGSLSVSHNAYLYKNLMVVERSKIMLLALLLSNIVGLLFASQGFAYWSLAIQTVVYTILSSSLFFYYSNFRPTLKIDFAPLKELYKFSSKILVTNIFIHINNNIYATVLGRFFPEKLIGNVNQASRWNNMGQSVITNMINNVIQPVLNQIQDDGERQIRVFRKILNFTAFVAFILLFGLATVAEDFIRITLTDKWIDTAPYLRILCIGGAFAAINNVFSNLILTKGKSSTYMYNVVSFGILQFLILVLCKDWGIQPAMMIITSLNLIWVFIWTLIIQKHITFSIANLFSDVFTYMLFAALACYSAYYISGSFENIYIRFITCLTLSGSIYLILNRIFKPEILTEIINFAKSSVGKKA